MLKSVPIQQIFFDYGKLGFNTKDDYESFVIRSLRMTSCEIEDKTKGAVCCMDCGNSLFRYMTINFQGVFIRHGVEYSPKIEVQGNFCRLCAMLIASNYVDR